MVQTRRQERKVIEILRAGLIAGLCGGIALAIAVALCHPARPAGRLRRAADSQAAPFAD